MNICSSQSSGHFTNYSPHLISESFVPILAGSNSGEGLQVIHRPGVGDNSEWPTRQLLVPFHSDY